MPTKTAVPCKALKFWEKCSVWRQAQTKAALALQKTLKETLYTKKEESKPAYNSTGKACEGQVNQGQEES